MKIMSEIATTYAGYRISDIPSGHLRTILQEQIDAADYVMGAELGNDEIAVMMKWLINFLYDKYGYLPLHHVRKAIEAGSLGQRLGTSKLLPRNVAIWISEQDKIFQEQNAADMRKHDEIRRNTELKAGKADSFVATAVRLKVSWLGDKRITSEQYDSFSSQKIYELLKQGVHERDINPRMVVPNYDN